MVSKKSATKKSASKKAAPKKPRAEKKKPVPEVVQEPTRKRSRVGIACDHSGSMQALVASAIQDYNKTLDSLKSASMDEGIETLVSVVRFGLTPLVQVTENNTQLSKISSIISYPAGGMTPLYESVLKLIELLQGSPEADDPNTTFLVMAITDGLENASPKGSDKKLAALIKKLQATDRWTFVFRLPPQYGEQLVRELGIYPGNIQEWEISHRGLTKATEATVNSIGGYYGGLSRGVTSTKSFYQVNTSNLNTANLQANMVDISREVEIWFVKDDFEGKEIRDFCLRNLKGEPFVKGCAFYLLQKKTVLVQEYKMICIRDKDSGKVYGGNTARQLLGIPPGRYNLKPGDHGKWDIYVQSTSVNRKLFTGDTVLYWRGAVR